jgi:hypothetical protein
VCFWSCGCSVRPHRVCFASVIRRWWCASVLRVRANRRQFPGDETADPHNIDAAQHAVAALNGYGDCVQPVVKFRLWLCNVATPARIARGVTQPARLVENAGDKGMVPFPREMQNLLYTASLAAFTGRALMIFRAGLALNTVGSFVNGLMPFRSLVAGFLMTTNLAKPGTTKAPFFFNSL